MRISDVFITKSVVRSKKLTKRFFFVGALITGLMSLVVVIVTIYGQHAGLISMVMAEEASNKGIMLSQTFDFAEPKTVLTIEPISEIGDMSESHLNIRAARSTDGQYYDPEIPYYIAYTFYIRNTGNELVNLNYRLRVLDSYKGVEKAVKAKYIEEDLTTGIVTDRTYQNDLETNLIINQNMYSFLEGTTKKVTLFIWFDGALTDQSMLGGSIKLEMNYMITTAEGK